MKANIKTNESEIIYTPDGRKIAIDRSVGVVMFAYIIKNNDVYILINKRGTKTSEFKTKWNLPSGYLNWNETGEEGAIRETYEETGVLIPLDNVKEIEHSTDPSENNQNIIFRYVAELNQSYLETELKPIDNTETTEAKWVLLSEINQYDFAFNQEKTIKRISNKLNIN